MSDPKTIGDLDLYQGELDGSELIEIEKSGLSKRMPLSEISLKGWSPVFSIEQSSGKTALKVADWTLGNGDKPPVGVYLGENGYVVTIEDAISIRGDQGTAGGPVVEIPGEFGIPYPTNEEFNGRTVWACRINLGAVAAVKVTKATTIPNAVTQEWDVGGEYPPRIDTSDSFITASGGGGYPLPYSRGDSLDVNCEITLITSNNSIATRVWNSFFPGLPHQCVIKYLKIEDE